MEGVSFEFGPPPTFVRPSTLLLPFSLSFPSLTCATIQHAIDSIPATKPSMSLESNTQSPNRRSMSALAPGSQAEEEEGDIVSKSKSSASELPPSLFLSREASPKEKRRKPGGSGEESASRERRCLSLSGPTKRAREGAEKTPLAVFFFLKTESEIDCFSELPTSKRKKKKNENPTPTP